MHGAFALFGSRFRLDSSALILKPISRTHQQARSLWAENSTEKKPTSLRTPEPALGLKGEGAEGSFHTWCAPGLALAAAGVALHEFLPNGHNHIEGLIGALSSVLVVVFMKLSRLWS